MNELPLPSVVRVHDDTGSHIEPELDETWDEPTKLAWQAAVFAHDTGLRIRVHDFGGTYGLNVGRHSLGDKPYHLAWRRLSYVSVGAEAMREMLEEGDRA